MGATPKKPVGHVHGNTGKYAGNAGKGRPKGKPNRITRELKEMILTALDEAGGVEYLKRQANESPAAFLTLVGKVLPMTLTGPGANGEHTVITEIVLRGVSPE